MAGNDETILTEPANLMVSLREILNK